MILFSINTQFSSFWPIDRTLSGATALGQSEPGSDGNEGVLCIPQGSIVTKATPSDCLVSYPGYLLEESYLSAEMQLVYSAAQSDMAEMVFMSYPGHSFIWGGVTPSVEIQSVCSAAPADWASKLCW